MSLTSLLPEVRIFITNYRNSSVIKEFRPFSRLSELESRLRQRKLPKPQEETAEKEIDAIKATLKEHEETLRTLRTENRRSLAMVAVFVVLFGSLYVMFTLLRQMGWV